MSERSVANYPHDHESIDYVMFVQTIDGKVAKTKMPRAQAEALRQMADAQADHDTAAPATAALHHEVVATERQPEIDGVKKVHLGKRAAKIALISTLVVGPFAAGDYVQTAMVRGEIPGPEVIVEDIGQLSGQLVEAGQNFGGFVEQVKGTIDTFGKLGGGK